MTRPDELLARARAWLADDPDEGTRAELTALIAGHEAQDETAGATLTDAFSTFLEFGTAGLRGALGPGPNRMNRSVVIRAAGGLTAYLQQDLNIATPTVVIGYDARYNSDVFAQDTAAVVTAAGGRALLLPEPLPTPVLAFAIRHLGADAGVMVTASHNPPQDNGYKVYLGDGSQIVPPADVGIATQIARITSLAQVPRAEQGWEVLGPQIVQTYVDAAVAILEPDGPRDLTVVHTALHGVGSAVLHRAFAQAGFAPLIPVSSQEQPDPEFPTVAFPNPEEPGAIDAALELAEDIQPDLVIANDPDADRCALAVREQPSGQWRMLRGDEVGALLGQHIIERGRAGGQRPVLARSIVSSRLLGAMAEASGLPAQETLTGFKWIGRVEGLAYGYEEALGYCVDPATVPDKDGISAALLAAELAAMLKERGRTLLDLLDDLAREHGVHATDAFSVRVSDLSLIPPVLQKLRDQTPAQLGGVPVIVAEDLSQGLHGLPPTDGLRFLLADETRIIVRPSGTEPKLKVYLEAVVPVADELPLGQARAEAARRLAAVRGAMEELTAI